VAKTAAALKEYLEYDASGLEKSPGLERSSEFWADWLAATMPGSPIRDYLAQYSDDREKQRGEIARLFAQLADSIVVSM
jgi:hypothetical protein